MLDHITRNDFLKLLYKKRTLWTGTYETHISPQNIDKLWKLINICFTHKFTDWCDSWVVLGGPCLFLLRGILDSHGTELVHLKCLIMKADPLLLKDQRTR